MLAGTALVVLFVAATAQAGGGREKVKLTPFGQASAKAVLMTKGDLGTGSGWTGGATKPDLANTLQCPGFHPKQSDLVLIGAAEVKYKHQGLQFDNEVEIMKTARMVRLDWERTVHSNKFLPCIRRLFASSLGAKGKLVSVDPLAMPPITRNTIAFRVRFDTGKPITHLLIDMLFFGKGRTEVSLATTTTVSAAAVVGKAELVLARRLARRIRA